MTWIGVGMSGQQPDGVIPLGVPAWRAVDKVLVEILHRVAALEEPSVRVGTVVHWTDHAHHDRECRAAVVTAVVTAVQGHTVSLVVLPPGGVLFADEVERSSAVGLERCGGGHGVGTWHPLWACGAQLGRRPEEQGEG